MSWIGYAILMRCNNGAQLESLPIRVTLTPPTPATYTNLLKTMSSFLHMLKDIEYSFKLKKELEPV